MSKIEMKVPSPGESITEVQIARWICKDGAYVEKDDEICEIDSDKATLTLNAEASGTIKILVKEGETVAVGAVVCSIDTEGIQTVTKTESKPVAKNEKASAVPAPDVITKEATTPASYASGIPSPAAEKLMKEKGIASAQVNASGKGGRITKGDVLDLSLIHISEPTRPY